MELPICGQVHVAHCTLNIAHCNCSLLIAHYNWSVHLEHCSLHLIIAHCSLLISHCTLQLVGALRSLRIARCSTKWALEQLWAAMKALLHLAKCCFRRERQDQYLRPTNDQPTTNGDQALAAAHHISQSACPIYQYLYQHLQKPHTRQLQKYKVGNDLKGFLDR